MILLTLTFTLSASSGLHMSFGTILGALLREFDESKSKAGNHYIVYIYVLKELHNDL